jgi:hypothetical protein
MMPWVIGLHRPMLIQWVYQDWSCRWVEAVWFILTRNSCFLLIRSCCTSCAKPKQIHRILVVDRIWITPSRRFMHQSSCYYIFVNSDDLQAPGSAGRQSITQDLLPANISAEALSRSARKESMIPSSNHTKSTVYLTWIRLPVMNHIISFFFSTSPSDNTPMNFLR